MEPVRLEWKEGAMVNLTFSQDRLIATCDLRVRVLSLRPMQSGPHYIARERCRVTDTRTAHDDRRSFPN